MKGRDFLKNIGKTSLLPFVHNKNIVTGVEKVKNYKYEDDCLLWCRIDLYESNLKPQTTWEQMERMVDDKLKNAKETIMLLIEDNWNWDK